ncbi:MAG: Gfo/Idh/MocA family oxidoreductase [Oscillospiraceae bacterium]|nr:Gfo/Idh/MocA family oxidoreductase [Oscillospiraceae bacterium]
MSEKINEKISEGATYAPPRQKAQVVERGEFVFSAAHLDHGHIYGMCGSLIDAGGVLKSVYDPIPERAEGFAKLFNCALARTEDELLSDKETRLVAGAAVTSERCALGLRVMDAGKDYFTDKAPLTTLDQLAAAKAKVAETGRKYMCYFGERLHNEASVLAGDLIAEGRIGRVIQVLGLGPHRLGAAGRPDWFFVKENYGGILCDIGSHQLEQFLFYTGSDDAVITSSHIANYNHPEYPGLDDFGDVHLVSPDGATGYFRLDWFTPDGLQNWGDGRIFILGTEGFIELRKYFELGQKGSHGSNLYLANGAEETYINAENTVGFPFFGQLILDCLNRTENAMTQAHCFKAAELAVLAQVNATELTGRRV